MQNVKDFRCRSRKAATNLLEGRCLNTVALNTEIERVAARTEGFLTSVLLHGHEIVRWSPCGTVVRIWSRGWRTVTTKDRINKCLPRHFGLHQSGKLWWITDCWGRMIPFREGMALSTELAPPKPENLTIEDREFPVASRLDGCKG